MFKNTNAVLWLIVLLSATSVSAQDKKIDSLYRILVKTDSLALQAKLNNDIAVQFYNGQVYHDSAYYYSDRAYQLSKENKFPKQQVRAIFTKALIRTSVGDYDLAIKNFENAKVIFGGLKDTVNQSIVSSSIGALYFEKKDYIRASEYFKTAISYSEAIGDSYGAAIDYTNLGETEYERKKFLLSKNYLEKAMKTFDSLGVVMAGAHICYGNTLLALKNIDKATIEGEIGYTAAKNPNDLKNLSAASNLLYKISIAKDDYEKAIGYFNEHVTYKDSLEGAKESNNIEKLKLNFDLSKKEKELSYLSQKSKFLYIIYTLAGLGLLLLVFLISRQRKMTKITREIHNIQTSLVSRELEARAHRTKRIAGDTSNFNLTRSQDDILNN